MNYLIKELRRHLWRTIASISGYIIAALFTLLVLSVTGTNEKDSFGILKGTGTHFIDRSFLSGRYFYFSEKSFPLQNNLRIYLLYR